MKSSFKILFFVIAMCVMLSPHSRVEAATEPTGMLQARPNPCELTPDQQTCQSRIIWNSSNIVEPYVQVYVNRKHLFSCGPSNQRGRQWTKNWIVLQPKEFTLYPVNDCGEKPDLSKPLASLNVSGQYLGTPHGTLTSEVRCVQPQEGGPENCSTALLWTSRNINYPAVQIRVDNKMMVCARSNLEGDYDESKWRRTIHFIGDWFNYEPKTFTLLPASDCGDNVEFGPVLDEITISAPPVNQPNIIFILADDLSSKEFPYLERVKSLLQEEGVTYPNFFTPRASCCPSRASMLTGRYAHNHQILHTYNDPNGEIGAWPKFLALGHEDSTVATWLKGAGYTTMYAGKYMNWYGTPWQQYSTYVPKGWDDWFGAMHNYYNGFNYTVNENGLLKTYGNAEDDYFTDVLTNKATQFIKNNADKPFFMVLGPTAPHVSNHNGELIPPVVAPRHTGEFLNVTLPMDMQSFNETDISDKPQWVKVKPLLSNEEIDTMQDEFVARLQSMLAIEDMIEKVIDELKSKGILDRTYIFFTSDHGYHMGEHRLFSAKDTLYEEDVRVPLIVRGPNLPKNVTKEEFVINHDLPITFAHLGGAQVPGFVDGMSMAFASTLQYQPRYFVLLEHWPKPNEFNLKGEIKGVRDNQYKYLEYDTGETELYDLQSDPHETNNLLGSPVEVLNLEVQYISNEMEKKLRELEACQTDACREAEQTGILTPYIPPRG